MFEPHERALMDYLERHFDRLILDRAPTERSLQLLIRVLAGILATEMAARDLTTTALTRTVDPYQRLLKTWTREALEHLEAAQRYN